ncbi:MAG: diaminopimelate dehydrogenase [Clostridia bacterium]|nr:diaminopimelate dehydrogenase [Clostridia bacterium]
MNQIRIAIAGYGNLGKGIEYAIRQNPDTELVAVFTRRDPGSVKINTPNVPVYKMEDAPKMKDQIDVMILCGGSATDLPKQTPDMAQYFNTVDSFDTHAKIPEQFQKVDAIAKANNHLNLISCGWDPGLFSLNRLYASCILPEGETYTFWGKGVSQGHSDAIRRIEGVQDAKQYTVPVEEAVAAVRAGKMPQLTTRQKHTRLCYVVAKEGADLARIEKEIKEMPLYFDEYDTTVHFISQEELDRDHSQLPHGGFVFRSGKSGENNQHTQIIEYALKLDSNPEFTSAVLVAYARAVCRLAKEGKTGCITVMDVAPAYLSPLDAEGVRSFL